MTRSVLPPPEQMYQIVNCGGGKSVPKLPRGSNLKDIIIVSCEEDELACTSALKVNLVTIVFAMAVFVGKVCQTPFTCKKSCFFGNFLLYTLLFLKVFTLVKLIFVGMPRGHMDFRIYIVLRSTATLTLFRDSVIVHAW